MLKTYSVEQFIMLHYIQRHVVLLSTTIKVNDRMNAQYMCFIKLTMAQERLRDIES